MINATEARTEFEKALEEAEEIRFYEYKHVEMLKEKRITLKPKTIELCHKRSCNAGDGCCHQFVIRSIPLCVY